MYLRALLLEAVTKHIGSSWTATFLTSSSTPLGPALLASGVIKSAAPAI